MEPVKNICRINSTMTDLPQEEEPVNRTSPNILGKGSIDVDATIR